jgi:hypothetical protein
VKVLIAALAIFSIPVTAQAASCRDYPASIRPALKPRVEALRLLEREAADRLAGLDTRPFAYLIAQARAVAGTIHEPKALQDEDTLERCADAVPRVRRVCGTAALALADALEEQAAGAASAISKRAYGEAIAICEGFMGLAPSRTIFRGVD